MNREIIRSLNDNIEVCRLSCEEAAELKKTLKNLPLGEKREMLENKLFLVRKVIESYESAIKRAKQYIKFTAKHNPKNMKPKSNSTTDPRIVGCVHRSEDTVSGKTLCNQHIDGDNCLEEECPYITDPEEFETITLARMGRVLNDVLISHGIPSPERKSIIKNLTKALEQ